jgi:hypothetical protein
MGDNAMSDPLDLVDRLAARARQHTPPPLSVADDVMRQLRKPERTPLVWMTACAVAAALLVIFLIGVPQSDPDSLDAVFQSADFIQTEGGF